MRMRCDCHCVKSGAAYGVNLSNGAKTKFANSGTFSQTQIIQSMLLKVA